MSFDREPTTHGATGYEPTPYVMPPELANVFTTPPARATRTPEAS